MNQPDFYPYRFKFPVEYYSHELDSDQQRPKTWNYKGEMDYLFGLRVTQEEYDWIAANHNTCILSDRTGDSEYCNVHPGHLTPNVPIRYRIKTYAEFQIEEQLEDGEQPVNWADNGSMDHLYGLELTHTEAQFILTSEKSHINPIDSLGTLLQRLKEQFPDKDNYWYLYPNFVTAVPLKPPVSVDTELQAKIKNHLQQLL